MMFRGILLLISILILSSNNIFAQAAQDKRSEDGNADRLTASRYQAMDDAIDMLMVERDRVMEESIDKAIAQRERAIEKAMSKSLYSKGKGKFIFEPVARNYLQRPAVENNNGAASFFLIQNNRNALSFDFESEREERKIASSAQPARRTRSLFEESLETDFKGSVYHPNLASFDIDLENGLSQTREKFEPNLTGKMKNSSLNQFHVASSFLRKKPYAFSLFADKSKEVVNREFFERQVIDSTGYAGNLGFKSKFIPVAFSFNNSSKTIDRASRPSQEFDDDQVSLNLSNESKKLGVTCFEATQDKFSRTESGTSDQKGKTRNYNLSNQKAFSQDNKNLLFSSLHYYDLTGSAKSKIFSLNEDLNIEHADYLDSSYSYGFSDRTSSGVNTRDNRGRVTLKHKLYESLVSSVSPYYFNSESSAFSQNVYGLSLAEDYMKKLGKIGRLSLGFGLSYSEEERKAPNSVIFISDELHTLTTGTVILLDKLLVDTSTMVVTDTTRTTTYTLNVDYRLINAGEGIQIQRIPAGSITNGQEVLVSYQAKSNPSNKFSTLGTNYLLRMDFLEDLIGVFYRLNKERHPRISGENDIILQSLDDTAVGLDFHYKNLNVEFEDEDYDSNLSPYRRLLLRESIFFNPTERSTLTFQSSQTIVRLVKTMDTQKFFDYLSRYSIGLSKYSRFSLEAGLRWQEGGGTNLDDLVASSNFELNLGKFQMDIRYDFKKQLYVGDKLLNHFFSFKTKRAF